MLAFAGPSFSATVRELDAAELRQVARSGEVLSLKRVIESVAKATGGEPIEARAFERNDIFYRIVLKKANGSVVSVIINARTGEQVGRNSAIGRDVAAAAEGGKGKGNKGKSQSAGSKDKSGGNSGGGGNGGGGGGNGGGGGGGGNGGGGGGGSSGGGGGGGNGGGKN